MSRCFPFPPPGYEREHKPEELALLKEVKHKEKKHKKEKKDKERRKDKDKKEKDESGEKKRDKKDRKGKHRDKKDKHKDKKDMEDRGKDKDKSSISEESTVAGKLEERIKETLHAKGHSKTSSLADEGKYSTFFQGQNGQSSQAANDAMFVLELDRRIRDEENGGGSRKLPEAPGTSLRNPSHIKKMETHRPDGEFNGKAMVENRTVVAKSTNEGTLRPVEEQNNWRLDNKEKHKEKGNDERGGKHKEKDKKSHGKDKDKKKEKKREEKAKLKVENKESEHEKSANVGTNSRVVATSNNSTKLVMDDTAALNAENLRKRKAMDTNGFLHDSEKIRPNKVQSLALNQSTENGRKLEASHMSTKSFSDKHPTPNHVWLDSGHRDRLSNGVIEAQKPSTSKPNSFTTNMVSGQTIVASKTTPLDVKEALSKTTHLDVKEALKVPKMKDRIAEEAPRRAPHPDSKYLSQVLTVPKMCDWSETDDQEWLFSKKGPPKRAHLELPGVNEEPRVWSEAVHIESADVYALPYVIPY